MRFTKIPLIATLMAVALSLLIVLPGLAQSSGFDDPKGQLSGGSDLTVAVLSDTAGAGTIAESYFNGDLYVSNDDDAHNTVRITSSPATPVHKVFNGANGELGAADLVDDTDTTGIDESTFDDDNAHCVIATVKNVRSGKSITVGLRSTAVTTDDNDPVDDVAPFAGMFNVIPAGIEERDGLCVDYTGTTELNEALGLIPARHGDTLRVTVAGVQGSVDLVVDAEGPEFDEGETAPEDGVYLGSTSIKFRFVVSDTDSGLRHDGELDYTRGDLDARAFNMDDDQFTTGEPRSVEDTGAAADISVIFGSNGEGEGGEDMSKYGSNGWRQLGDRAGVSYLMNMSIGGQAEGIHYWYLEAKDRAGNTTRTDADDDPREDYRLWVDVSNPEFKDARTGISYDTDDRKEIVDRSSIAVTFEEGDGGLDSVMNIDADKFLVEDAEVVGVIQPGAATRCKGDSDDYPLDIDENCGMDDHPQARIYLQLAEDLAPDAEPVVSMFGGAVLDRAGNPSNQDEVDADDYIAPTLTVTLTSAVMDRPVLRHNSEFTVTISSDEELRRAPTVWFAELDDASTSDAEKSRAPLGSASRGDRVVAGSEDNSWEQTFRTNDVGNEDGAYAVIVIGEDDNDNVGSTPGWANKRTDKAPIASTEADPRKASLKDLIAGNLLVEVDTNENVGDPGFELSPEAGVDTDETESRNPYVTVSFADEKNEYDKTFKGDSHSAVEIVSITLNGDNVADLVSEVENNEYTVGLKDLEVGSYDLKVTGRDDVGNEVSDTYEFDVVPRDPYEVDLIPGWNLVSVPGTPLDSSTGAVMGSTNEATIVLAYQNDEWLTAVNDQGEWRGTLTDIVGGYGYWVQTTAFETIETLIPETDTSSVLPTARVIKGWNLLGVVDVAQADAGDAPSGGGEADDYFNNFDWRVAYAFETETNQWTKTLPDVQDSDTEIKNGKGYWVWSTETGTLVP